MEGSGTSSSAPAAPALRPRAGEDGATTTTMRTTSSPRRSARRRSGSWRHAGLRLDRFADAHDAATRRAAERRRQLANAKKGTAELKRVASAVPLAPRDGTLRHPSTAPPPPGGGGGGGEGDYAFHHETVRDDEEQWRMLRLRTGETVYFGAPDTLPETVAAWLDGTKPWPEIRAMELSIAARRAMSVPLARGTRRVRSPRRRPRRSCGLPRRTPAAAAAEEEASKDGGVAALP